MREAYPETDLETAEPAMRQALDLAFQAAASEATVLLRGESGTGKGVLARAMHARSPRAGGPFVTVHCPSLSAELLESELFGHVKGAFTGAVHGHRPARWRRPTAARCSSTRSATCRWRCSRSCCGCSRKRPTSGSARRGRASCDVRILAATNRDLAAETAAGRFREDLYYRLNVIEVVLPPLRGRRGDILPLAEHLLRFFARQTGKPVDGLQRRRALAALARYGWPGNVRELRNAVERGVILAAGREIDLAHLPAPIGSPPPQRVEVGGRVTLDALEAEHIRRVLAATPSLDEAAAVLGIDPSTLYRKRKRYGL